MMKINLTSVTVADQNNALKFSTDVLGDVKKTEIPAAEFEWLTVGSPEGPNDLEWDLQPNVRPAAVAVK